MIPSLPGLTERLKGSIAPCLESPGPTWRHLRVPIPVRFLAAPHSRCSGPPLSGAGVDPGVDPAASALERPPIAPGVQRSARHPTWVDAGEAPGRGADPTRSRGAIGGRSKVGDALPVEATPGLLARDRRRDYSGLATAELPRDRRAGSGPSAWELLELARGVKSPTFSSGADPLVGQQLS